MSSDKVNRDSTQSQYHCDVSYDCAQNPSDGQHYVAAIGEPMKFVCERTQNRQISDGI